MPIHSSRQMVAFTVLAICAAGTAFAQDIKRKPGLWDIHSTVMGMNTGVQQCVGPASDDLMARPQRDGQRPECDPPQISRQSDGVHIHSVCKIPNRTVTTDGLFTGSFDTAYKGKLTSRIDPPQNGVATTEIAIDARWTGPCAAGQKPGDTVVSTSGGQRIDMNDPRIRDAMEKLRAAQGAQKQQ
jgi:hypothetical protein